MTCGIIRIFYLASFQKILKDFFCYVCIRLENNIEIQKQLKMKAFTVESKYFATDSLLFMYRSCISFNIKANFKVS